MYTSFSTALSGLNADTQAIDIVGNNLANLNTTGYKASSVSFQDLVSQSLSVSAPGSQVGLGVGHPLALRQFNQGAIQTTSGLLDAGIQGDGFFVVNSPSGATQYTRDGSFQVDKNGLLTTASGQTVQGWTATGGVLNTSLAPGNMVIPIGSVSAPVATGNVSLTMNLDSTGTAAPPPKTFSTSVQVYDSLGTTHNLNITFTKNAKAGQWDYSITVPASDTAAAFTPVTGSLVFDSSGKLTTPAVTDTPPQIKVAGLADGAADLNINWNLYNGTTPTVTQFAQASAVSAIGQDGSAASQLTKVAIGAEGQITAEYSNGLQQVVGQVALALIRNPQSLAAVGDNSFETSGSTSLPAIGVPGTGGRGSVTGGVLESSTVDIAREFTNLIVFQRGYEANAKVITSVDEISQDTINLKR